MARASEQEQTGSIGVSEVTSAFARLNWGYAEIARHDNGIDLFLMARDERRFDLGLTLGAQVKAGPSYFRRPKISRGQTVGWWFTDADGQHLQDLVDHRLPQILVLHHVAEGVTFWVQVTADRVVRTGKGSKILVPKDQTVDEAHRSALLEVAAAPHVVPGFEGTAWTGVAELSDRDQLRTAILAPRLIAPHANAGHGKPVDSVQAIALMMQARVQDYDQFAEQHEQVPSRDEAVTSTDWLWRFVGQLALRVTTGSVDGLVSLIDDAPSAVFRCAAAAVYAGGLLEEDRPDDCVDLLREQIAVDDALPVDQAWLSVHLARAQTEVGDTEEARRLAASVQGLQISHPGDVTAVAIEGVGATMLFRLSDIWSGDVSLAIRGRDTAVMWWRQQTRSWGLGAALNHSFESWARDDRRWFARIDDANDQLVSAALLATTAADQDDWRYLAQALGRSQLVRLSIDHTGDSSARWLGLLRLAGDAEGLILAAKHLLADGDALEVQQVTGDIDLERATRTTARADLALLKAAGSALDATAAPRIARKLLQILTAPDAFSARTSHRPPPYDLLEALDAVLEACPADVQQEVILTLLAGPPLHDQLTADRWAKVLTRTSADQWAEDDLGQLKALEVVPESQRFAEVRLQLLESAGLVPARDLQAEIRAGSLDALERFGSVDRLDEETASSVIARAAEALKHRLEEAHAGRYGMGGPDWLDVLAVMNLWHPNLADWDPLVTALTDPALPGTTKTRALGRLAHRANRIPAEVQEQLRELRADDSSPHWLLDAPGGAAARGASLPGAVTLLRGALGAVLDPDQLQRLFAGDVDDRIWAARVAGLQGGPEAAGLLVALAHDVDARVRREVGVHLLRLVSTGSITEGGAAALRSLAADPGLIVPRKLAVELAALLPSDVALLNALAEHLRASPLLPVRRPLLQASPPAA